MTNETQLKPFYAGQKVVIELTEVNAKTLNEEQRMFAGRCFPDGDYIVPLESCRATPPPDRVKALEDEHEYLLRKIYKFGRHQNPTESLDAQAMARKAFKEALSLSDNKFKCPDGLTCSGDGWDCVGDGLCSPRKPMMDVEALTDLILKGWSRYSVFEDATYGSVSRSIAENIIAQGHLSPPPVQDLAALEGARDAFERMYTVDANSSEDQCKEILDAVFSTHSQTIRALLDAAISIHPDKEGV